MGDFRISSNGVTVRGPMSASVAGTLRAIAPVTVIAGMILPKPGHSLYLRNPGDGTYELTMYGPAPNKEEVFVKATLEQLREMLTREAAEQ